MNADKSKPSKFSFSPPRKLFRIGEIINHTGLSRQTIHNYTMFGLITEAERTKAGHRLYSEDVFSRLSEIEELKAQKKTLREIRELLLGNDI
jgi:DNA-binding transcriptional MerR regulator